MEKTYRLKVAGLERELPICPLNKKMSIAAFIMFSDVELTVACAKELLTRVPDFDVIVTAESKGIPLAYEMARQSGKNYYPARKAKKLYMSDPVAVEVKSITTANRQTLYLDRHDMDALAEKRVLKEHEYTLAKNSDGTITVQAAEKRLGSCVMQNE